jgi:uncharacterized protein (DUF2267 family)
VNYPELLDRVAEKTGLQPPEAEVPTKVVLSVLGERLSAKEAHDLASELPRQVKRPLVNAPAHGREYGAGDFVHQVAEREKVPEPKAREHVQAVLSTVREAVSTGEYRDVAAEMWRDPAYRDLWTWSKPAGARIGYDEFLERVQERTGLGRALAELATQATVSTLAERISGGDAEEVALELPVELRQWMQKTSGSAERFGAEEFVRRVAAKVPDLKPEETDDVVRAVLTTLREGVSRKEVLDTLSQLPMDVRRLFAQRMEGAGP